MLQNDNNVSDNLYNNNNDDNIDFSFGKQNNFRNNSNNKNKKLLSANKINMVHNIVNDKESSRIRKKNGNLIFNLLNRNKNRKKETTTDFFKHNTINQSNLPTKNRIIAYNSNSKSSSKKKPKKNVFKEKFFQLFTLDNNINTNVNNIKIESKKYIKKICNIKNEEDLPYEIKYFFDFPEFNYDFQHQNDNNSNSQYVNENFIDILMISSREKVLGKANGNGKKLLLKDIQKEITFSKRNILISWLTEMNIKYIKDQNALFLAIKFLDRILYKQNININEFQLLGILCFNLALKMENHHKVFIINEIISLIGGVGEKEGIGKDALAKKIIKMEHKICDMLDFDFETSTSVLILKRLIQIINIENKRIEEILTSIAYFFLELSLYDEQFYELDEFVKALSSLLMAKEILNKFFYKIGFHTYLIECCKLKMKEIKYYYTLCSKVIKNLKEYKYGNAIFIKYQQKDFYHVINNYLEPFIIDCIKDKNNLS